MLSKQHVATGYHIPQESSKRLLVSYWIYLFQQNGDEWWLYRAMKHNPKYSCCRFQLLIVFQSGLIAVSVAVRLSFEDRVHFSGKLLLQPSLILFWSFSDPIHPQVIEGSCPRGLISNIMFTFLFSSFNCKILYDHLLWQALVKLGFLQFRICHQFEQN